MVRVLLLSGLVAWSAQALAWNGLGHQVIAAIAWKRLDQPTKVEIAHILMRGDKVDGQFSGQTYTNKLITPTLPDALLTDRYLDEYVQPVFVQGATWPDDIKSGKSQNFDSLIDQLNATFPLEHVGDSEKVRCKSWHYLDVPLVLHEDGTIGDGRVEDFPYSPSSGVAALNEIIKKRLNAIPMDGNTSPDSRAVYLFFGNHIVGDLHQPLHCVSLYGKPFPKLGDAGGNLFALANNGNLHRVWDGGIDQVIRQSGIERRAGNTELAIELAGRWVAKSDEQPRIAEVEKQDPMRWVVEGKDLAISTAYAGIKMGDAPSAEYLAKVAATSKSQALLGGYRLGEFLKRQLR